MAIDQVYVTQQLRSVVIHSLDNFNYKNAEFACERLLALDQNNLDSIYLYCLTLFKQGRYKSVFNFSIDQIHNLNCAYIYARSCLVLGKYKEGIYALLQVSHYYNETSQNAQWFSDNSQRLNYESNRQVGPDSSTIYHLLGDLYKGVGDIKNSALSYISALKINQFDFEAFQKLSKLGVEVKIKQIYTPNNSSKGPSNNPFAGSPLATNGDNLTMASNVNLVPSNGNTSIAADDTFGGILSTPRVGNNSKKNNYFNGTSTTTSNSNHNNHNNRGSIGDIFSKPSFTIDLGETKKNRNTYSKFTSRLTTSKDRSNLKRNSTTANASSVVIEDIESNQSLDNSIQPPHGGSISPLQSNNLSGESYLLSLYAMFAKGYKCISKYDCYKAIKIFESLPEHEKNTPWVLAKLGKLHYEIVNYKKSEYFFVKLRQLDRTRMEDMEYYSTLLWHLHNKVDLTFLANELYDLDPKSAITWCVIGNLFSLAREPDEAIKCFNKAVKIDNKFVYAHTLKGHEYFSNDNYEMALENFRISLLLDPRHYNALYGIGMVYINLGDYQKADFHFRKAVSINPINIILICCVGMVLEKMDKKSLALKQYELANKLQPLNPLPIFKKAQLLFAMQEFQQALECFEKLKELAPEEASVHFLLGQLYKIHNDKFKAIREFTIALLLDPKGNYLIRDAMESLKS